jgi:hypothetical protein
MYILVSWKKLKVKEYNLQILYEHTSRIPRDGRSCQRKCDGASRCLFNCCSKPGT